MTTNDANAPRQGFCEQWLRRCGERPWRWFLVIWLSLVLIWLIVGFVGFRHQTWENRPPPPEGIPYADHVAGGAQSYNLVLDLDPASLPKFDPSAARPELNYQVVTEPDGSKRFLAYVRTAHGHYGWPSPIVKWLSDTVWDVSDPAQPFKMYAPLGINWKTAQRLDERDCSLSWPGDTPSTYNHVDIVWFDALRVLLAMELVAAASVYIPWAIFVIRDRRRRRATRCLMCGHQLGPSPRPARCPECGSSVQTGQPRKPTSLRQRLGARPGRVCLMVWLILILSWIVASIALGGRLPLPNLVDRLAEEAADTRHRPADQTSYYSAGVDIREYGWPCMVVSRWIIQSFKFEPGQEPVAVPRTRIEPGFYIGDHRDVQWIWRRDDPTTSGTLAIQWAMGLLQLYGLHLAAVAMTWGIMAVTALCAMTRSARPQAA